MTVLGFDPDRTSVLTVRARLAIDELAGITSGDPEACAALRVVALGNHRMHRFYGISRAAFG